MTTEQATTPERSTTAKHWLIGTLIVVWLFATLLGLWWFQQQTIRPFIGADDDSRLWQA